MIGKIVKTEKQWKEILTPEQFRVMHQKFSNFGKILRNFIDKSNEA